MDIDALLRALEVRYRHALSASVSAKAHYLALRDEPSSTPASIQRARQQWEKLDARKREIAAGMGEAEDREQNFLV
jgi:hypothetical protein